MAIRIKSNWSKTVKRQKTSDDIASALSYIGWKLSLDKSRNLHGEDFDYSSDHQRIAVIVEFMSFQVHIADRLLFIDKKNDDYRMSVMNTLGKQSARIMQENCEDLFGIGEVFYLWGQSTNLLDTYFIRFSTPEYSATRKVSLIK